jgi:hypothetical protein
MSPKPTSGSDNFRFAHPSAIGGGRNGASNSLFSTRLSAQSVVGGELGPRTGTTQEAGRRSVVGGVQLWRAKHSDHLGRNSKSKDRYGLELLAMCVVA